MDREYTLGIDYGTSNTVAVLRWPDGRVKPLLFDGSPLLPSAVFLDDAGGLLVGREALHSARRDPARFEPNPKRSVDDGAVLLGESELPVTALIAAALRTVATEAVRTAGDGAVRTVVLTCPAAWGPRRRQVLHDAAQAAGLGQPRIVPEPIAAASYFLHHLGVDVPLGQVAVVYDLGAGTFDVSLVRRDPTGLTVLATDGLSDVGGLDVDAALVGYFGAVYGAQRPQEWQRLESPQTAGDRRLRRQLWDDVRIAKELLSRSSATMVFLSGLDVEAQLGREQVENLAGGLLRRTVDLTRTTVRRAGLTGADIAGLFLVGGASRMPVIATMLHRALDLAPVVIEQPELVVAEGSVAARHDHPDERTARAAVVEPVVLAVMPTVEEDAGSSTDDGYEDEEEEDDEYEEDYEDEEYDDETSQPPVRQGRWSTAVRRWVDPQQAHLPIGQLPMRPIQVSLPSGLDGHTMRFHVDDDPGNVAFIEADGRLLLFSSPKTMVRHLVSSDDHPLADLEEWPTLRSWLADAGIEPDTDDIVDFDVMRYAFELPPQQWIPRMFVVAYTTAWEIASAFNLPETLHHLAAGQPLNQVDAMMQVADQPIAGRRARRQIQALETGRIRQLWLRVIKEIDGIAQWTD